MTEYGRGRSVEMERPTRTALRHEPATAAAEPHRPLTSGPRELAKRGVEGQGRGEEKAEDGQEEQEEDMSAHSDSTSGIGEEEDDEDEDEGGGHGRGKGVVTGAEPEDGQRDKPTAKKGSKLQPSDNNDSARRRSEFGLDTMRLLNEALCQEIAPKQLLRQVSLNLPTSHSAKLKWNEQQQAATRLGSLHLLDGVLERLETNQQRWRPRKPSTARAGGVDQLIPEDGTMTPPLLPITVVPTTGGGDGLHANDSGLDGGAVPFVGYSNSDTFEVKFGQGFLGLEFVVNATRGQVVVKNVPDDSRSMNILQIPPGASVTRGLIVDAVNGRDLSGSAPEDVLDILQHTQRPFSLRFRRCAESMVLCKLCECKVDAWNLDEHTNYCVMSRRFELEADEINNSLAAVGASITTHLQSESLRCHFNPEVLHFFNALRVIAIQASSCDVSNVESFALCSRLIKIIDRIRLQEPVTANSMSERGFKYCSRVRNLIHTKMSKMRQTHKVLLQQAPSDGPAPFQRTQSLEKVQHGTISRLQGAGAKKPSACRVSLRDFHIVKPISKGAFGKVYLARKKTTGDQYAIKVLAKEHVIRKKQHIETERDILVAVESPFVVKLFWTFQTMCNLFLVMEYLPGGDFMSLLECIVQLEEQVAQVYIAEIALALNHLHSKGCVHRDLKPDNVLISKSGHIKLTDFGLSEEGVSLSDSDSEDINDRFEADSQSVDTLDASPDSLGSPQQNNIEEDFSDCFDIGSMRRRQKKKNRDSLTQTFGRCGTPDYLSPEIILGESHGPPVDYWALGVILYEMLVGFPPFNDETVDAIFNNILERQVLWPDGEKRLSKHAIDLIDHLLDPDPSTRLGWTGLQQHPFFHGINWDTLLDSIPPFVPTLEGPNDTSYFNNRNLTDIFVDDEEFDFDEQSVHDSSLMEESDSDFAINSASLRRSIGQMGNNRSGSTSTSMMEEDSTSSSVDVLRLSILKNSQDQGNQEDQFTHDSAFHDPGNTLRFPSGMYNNIDDPEVNGVFRFFSITNMNALTAATRTEAVDIAKTRKSEVESPSAVSIVI